MIESVIVMLMIGLVFFALFQYANLLSAKLVLNHAAARAARARTVGLNHWMVEKSAKAAAIPVSGRCLTAFTEGAVGETGMAALLRHATPGRIWNASLRTSPYSARAQFERARIPDYMDSMNSPTSGEVLDYERWENLTVSLDEPLGLGGSTPGKISMSVRQRQPLLIAYPAMAEGELQSLTEGDIGFVRLQGDYSIESHYPLYMENMNW